MIPVSCHTVKVKWHGMSNASHIFIWCPLSYCLSQQLLLLVFRCIMENAANSSWRSAGVWASPTTWCAAPVMSWTSLTCTSWKTAASAAASKTPPMMLRQRWAGSLWCNCKCSSWGHWHQWLLAVAVALFFLPFFTSFTCHLDNFENQSLC